MGDDNTSVGSRAFLSANDTKIDTLTHEVARLTEAVEKLNLILTGNGDPARGMAFRLLLVEKTQFWHVIATVVNLVLLGAMVVWVLLWK